MPCSAEIEPPAAVTRSSTNRGDLPRLRARTSRARRGFRRGRGSGCCRRRDGQSRWRSRRETRARPRPPPRRGSRGMSATGTEMSCASVCPSARSASEMLSRSFQKASACASFAASAASPMMPCLKRLRRAAAPAPRRCRCRHRRSSPRPARASGCCAGERRASARNVLEDELERILRHQLEALDAHRCAPRGSAAGRARAPGLSTPAQATARAATAGTSRKRDGGDHAERAFGTDQKLVEAVAAIVLLEAREAAVDRAVGKHRLDARDQRRASCRTSAPEFRRRWSR